MVDANIPDIALEPDKTVKKVIGKLHLLAEQILTLLKFFSSSDGATNSSFLKVMESGHFTEYLKLEMENIY